MSKRREIQIIILSVIVFALYIIGKLYNDVFLLPMEILAVVLILLTWKD